MTCELYLQSYKKRCTVGTVDDVLYQIEKRELITLSLNRMFLKQTN